MASKLSVIHYINQFFGQVGGEERASTAPFLKEGCIGPGVLLKSLLGGKGEIIATIICGDNFFSEKLEIAKKEVLNLISRYRPDLIVAGPAFNAGRYGIACGEVCKLAKEELGIQALTGMYRENPGVELFKRDIYIVETGPSARSMTEALTRMIGLGLKLVSKEPVGRPDEEGYIPRGIKRNVLSEDLASERAIVALLAKIKGESFHTEIKKYDFEQVPPAPPVEDLSHATIALVTEGGLVPKGNPDHIEGRWATKYRKYSLEGLVRLDQGVFESIHRGVETTFINEDPNRLLPVDVVRDMEQEGIIGRLHPYFFTTAGCGTFVEMSQKMGQGIAGELKDAGVTGVILTAT